MPTQRKLYLDNICGVLILHMIFTYHIVDACGYDSVFIGILSDFLSFFMTWFFFKGGMMHKDVSTVECIRNSTKRLLVPFLTFVIIGIIIDAFEQWKVYGMNPFTVRFIINEGKTFLHSQMLWSTAASWFLLTLFLDRIAFSFMKKHLHPICIAIISLIAAYLVFLLNTSYIPFYVGTMFHGLGVYCLGFYLKELQFKWQVLSLAVLLFLLNLFLTSTIDFRNNSTDSNYIFAVFAAIAACIVFNNLFSWLFNFKIPILTYIGENSMVYYLVHWPVMYIMIHLFWGPFEMLSISMQYGILCVIVLVVCVLIDFINHRVPWLQHLMGM